jgi:pyruvate,orthophosphate dikinase
MLRRRREVIADHPVRPVSMAESKYVYFFGGKADGRADMKNLLGGKGANLAEMTNIGSEN